MGFWDALWDLLGITTVSESLRRKSEKKQGLEVTPKNVVNAFSQGGIQLEAKNLYEIVFNFVFNSKLKSSFSAEGIEHLSDKEIGYYKKLNEYNLIINFVRKFGTEYGQEDFDNLKKLFLTKGIFLSDENILTLIFCEKTEQEFLNFKEIFLECNPITLNNYLEIFVKNFGREINSLIKCKEKVNKFGIYESSDGEVCLIESIMNEKVTTEKLTRITKLTSLENYIKQIVFITRKLYFLKRLLLEKDAESYSKNIISDDGLFIGIINAKNNYDLMRFEEGLYHEEKINIDEIDAMEGHEFERFLKTLFEKMSYVVEHTKLTGDQGADLVISKLGKKIVVQAKRSNTKIGNGAIQEVVASINHYKVDNWMTVTNNYFTPSSIALAKSNKITLIDRDELNRLIKDFL